MDWYINTIKNISFWPHFNQTHNIQRWKRFVCVIWSTFALKHWIQRLLCRHVYMYIETLAFSVNMHSESILMLMMNVDDEDDQTRNTRKYVQYRTHAWTVHALLCINAAQRTNLYYVNKVQYIFRRKDVVVIKKRARTSKICLDKCEHENNRFVGKFPSHIVFSRLTTMFYHCVYVNNRIQHIRCTEDIFVLRNLDEIHKRKYR